MKSTTTSPAPQALRRVPGLDYLAQLGSDPDVSVGVVQAIGPDGQTNTMEASVCRRFFPHERPIDPSTAWDRPTCFHWEVTPPLGSGDEFWKNPQGLCRAYDAAAFPGLRDVLISVTLRAPSLEASGLGIRDYHHVVAGYVEAHLSARGLPTITVIHVPSRAARPGPVHWHCLIAARRWSRVAGPSTFCRELLTGGRALVEQEWGDWKRAHGL